MDVLLELTDGLHTEGVRHGLALAGMLRAVARVEETTVNGDEGIVEVTEQELISFRRIILPARSR